MKILINDIMQIATGAPDLIKSPALADTYEDADNFTITFDEAKTVNCLGLGYTDATEIQITNDTDTRIIAITKDAPFQNGLYIIEAITTKASTHEFTITHNGTFIGRVGIGTYRQLGTSATKEIGFYTTNENRTTTSGQVISGVGGFYGRVFDADIRYKIDSDIYDDIETAFPDQIMKGFPYFIDTEDEQHKLPTNMRTFYAKTDVPISKLQSSIYRFLYSYKFKFIEAF